MLAPIKEKAACGDALDERHGSRSCVSLRVLPRLKTSEKKKLMLSQRSFLDDQQEGSENAIPVQITEPLAFASVKDDLMV